MNGIKMSDCKFYIDEAARTVVCVISNTQDMVEDFIYEHFNFNEIDCTAFGRLRNAIKMPHSFMGKAVCSPNDEWNEETGKLIAFSRAKDKCYKSFFKRANSFIQSVDRRLGDMIDLFNDFGMKLEDKREGMTERIKELTGVIEEEDKDEYEVEEE